MAATKDSKKLLIRCLTQEIPVFVLTGSDKCAMAAKSRKTKSDGREKRKAIFEAKTKCAQKSRLLPPSGQNTSVVQTPFESCLNDAFLLNFLLKYHLKTHCQFSKKSYLYIVVMLPLCIPSRPHS